ncbi:sugar ABC transporter ATP-binding protein [Mariniplasma anaerobium]|uniref:Ribose import ATP-binding protein RbsA n=1 Tax=Mariniplasma anaerobium TaxID=2735436 RepID=A0A7U9TI52_9MOLU|nr:sugar ABC transporter ATP-binding protein [Mariniplasma anaerobium]BCR36720.1 ribose import ATP-binding protein RbsA [Mariniplasma anaerobium]
MNIPILEMNNIVKSYPGVIALNKVSLNFFEGEVHAIVGENGAGKSTLIKVISGAVHPESGSIVYQGIEYSHLSLYEAKMKGIEVVYQEFSLIESLSVAENIFLGDKVGNFFSFKNIVAQAEVLFRKYNIDIDVRQKVSELSPAQMQLTEIVKAVSKSAKVLVLDEPSAPLSIAETNKMYEIIKEVKKNGTTIIYISHRLEEIFKISDRVTVLRDGILISTLPIIEVTRKKMIEMMVGRKVREDYPIRKIKYDDIALEVKNMSGNGVKDISFSLRKGEILGVAGLMGSGRTEMAMAIYGGAKKDKGEIFINGEKVLINSPHRAIYYGMGLIPEDRKRTGCFLEKTIQFNLSIASIRNLSNGFFVDKKREIKQSKYYSDLLNIKTPSLNQVVRNLSGGNQQKVVVGKTLGAQSRIIIFDEPTRGIDVGAKMEIYELMNQLADEGNSILMISSDLVELIGMSDRIMVLSEGKLMGELYRKDFSQTKIIDMASGNN